MVVDAVYFDGVWEKGFDPSQTSPRPFTLSDGTTVQVPTMSGTVDVGVGFDAATMLSVYGIPSATDVILPAR